MNRTLKIIFTFLLVLLTIIIWGCIIWGRTQLGDGWRFGISFIWGIVLGYFIFILWRSLYVDKKVSFWNYLSFILGALSILISIVPNVFYQQFSIGVDNLYDKSVCVDFTKELDENNDDEPHVFFAFDKTAYKETPTISSDLQDIYEGYISDIKTIYPDVKKEESNVSYREFCRAKICSDLLKLKDTKGFFSIYIIESDTKELVKNKPFKVDNIKNAIIKLCRIQFSDNNNTETDFVDFYTDLCNVIQSNCIFKQQEFTKYVLYAYSDFIHDRNKKIKIGDYNIELNTIIGKQKDLYNMSLVQNLFVIPYIEQQSNTRKYIIDNSSKTRQLYLNVFYLDKYIPETDECALKYHRIKYLKDIPIYQSNNTLSCSPNLLFLSKNYQIRMCDLSALKLGQQIHLKLRNECCLTDNFIPIDTTTVSFLYSGNTPTDESQIFLDIAKEGGIHGLVRLDFKKSYPEFLKWVIPSICLISGIWLIIVFLKCLNELNFK